MIDSKTPPRLLTPQEFGFMVRTIRTVRQWSQEQLADIAGINTRTVQRIESGTPSSLDARRALASAFGCEDIDAFNKPISIPTEEEIAAAQAEFERTHLTLKALPVASGWHLAELAAAHSMDVSSPAFRMDREAEEVFARLTDYFRDYRDIADDYSAVDKLGVYGDLQAMLDELAALNVSVRYAVRPLSLRTGGEAPGLAPWKTSALYLVTFERGREPDEIVTPREFSIA